MVICLVIHYWQKGEVILLEKKNHGRKLQLWKQKVHTQEETLLYSKVAIIENKKFQGRQMQITSALLPFFSFPNLNEFSSPLLALPSQSLILNSVGCTEAETPEDLKSAFKIVSGSTSAGGFEEVLALDRRGSPSFFTEGVSLNRLED